MTVDIKGLKGNAKKTAIETLNACLADSIAFGLAVKQAHWNVKGRNFIAVHELLDTVYANVQEQIDIFAERVQILDGVADGTLATVSKSSRIAPYPTDLVKVDDHIKAICDRLRDLGGNLRAGIDATEADADTADILTAASRVADKDLWFLSSHLDVA